MIQICVFIQFLVGWYFCRSIYCVFHGVFVDGLGGG
jgi:hypothetical protein